MPPQLGKPITLPPPLRTLRRTHRTLGLKLGQIQMLTHMHTQTGNGKLAAQNRFQHFYCHFGTPLHLFCQKAVWNARKSMVESLTNVTAVNNDCYLLLPAMFYVRLPMMILIVLSLKTICLALFIPQLQDRFAAEPRKRLCSTINNRSRNSNARWGREECSGFASGPLALWKKKNSRLILSITLRKGTRYCKNIHKHSSIQIYACKFL